MTSREASPEALLAARIGLDPQAVGTQAIARALCSRVAALGLNDRDEYVRRLARSEDEQQELIEEVVIPESWFFRDGSPFETLHAFVAAAHRGGTGGAKASSPTPPLRFLSIPCACGEE